MITETIVAAGEVRENKVTTEEERIQINREDAVQ